MNVLISVLALVTAIIIIATKVIEFRMARLKHRAQIAESATATPPTISQPILKRTAEHQTVASVLGSFMWMIFSLGLILYFIQGPDRPAQRSDIGWVAFAILQVAVSYLDLTKWAEQGAGPNGREREQP